MSRNTLVVLALLAVLTGCRSEPGLGIELVADTCGDLATEYGRTLNRRSLDRVDASYANDYERVQAVQKVRPAVNLALLAALSEPPLDRCQTDEAFFALVEAELTEEFRSEVPRAIVTDDGVPPSWEQYRQTIADEVASAG